jgi:hypothetical protein
MRKVSSVRALRWAAVFGTVVLALLAGGVVAADPRPNQAALHPAVKLLPSDASVHTRSYVS